MMIGCISELKEVKPRRGTIKGDRSIFRHFWTDCDRIRVAVHTYFYRDYAIWSSWLRYAQVMTRQFSTPGFKGPTLSPAYPGIGYITLSYQSQLTGLNCFWSAKHEMRVHWDDYRKTGAEVLRPIYECGEKRKTFIFCWCESTFLIIIYIY